MAKLGGIIREYGPVGEPDDDPLEQLCPFKKHRGETWRQVLDEDPQYVEWLLFEAENILLNERLFDELLWALEERA